MLKCRFRSWKWRVGLSEFEESTCAVLDPARVSRMPPADQLHYIHVLVQMKRLGCCAFGFVPGFGSALRPGEAARLWLKTSCILESKIQTLKHDSGWKRNHGSNHR